MELGYLWDTNIAIYFLQKQYPQAVELEMDKILKNGNIAMSVITEIELLCWKHISDLELINTKAFINRVHIQKLDETIKDITIHLRRNYKIKLPDAIIAATAISLNYTLVTRNTTDFESIDSLQILDPWLLV